NWEKGFAVAIFGGVGVYSLIYTAAFAGVMATPPTMVEAADWIETNIPPNETIEQEPEILFNWLVPKLSRQEDGASARWALVLTPNAEVFLNYAATPESYAEIDWYPVEEIELDRAVEFYTRILGDASRYALVQRFRRGPRFLGIPISDQGAPFPMRALAHPEIRIYRRLHD
ncbi:MAG: hypothetical protein O7E52_30250, partial [Candidatus Poribacteria bacterium]|nr:hypothetical protein [Candidatus Poribacteria bacterium]